MVGVIALAMIGGGIYFGVEMSHPSTSTTTESTTSTIIPTTTPNGKRYTHLQNKQFALKFKFRRNASKFPMFI